MINFEKNNKSKKTDNPKFSERTLAALRAGTKYIEILNLVKIKLSVSQTELAKVLNMDEGQISKIVGALEREHNLINSITGAELKTLPHFQGHMDAYPPKVKSRQKYLFLSEKGDSFVDTLEQICYNLEFSPVQVPLSRSKSLREEERRKIDELVGHIGEKEGDPHFLVFYLKQLVSIIRYRFIPAHRHGALYDLLCKLITDHDVEVRKEAIRVTSYLWRIAIIYYDEEWLRDHPWDELWKIFENIEDSEVGLKIELLGNAMELLLRAYTLFREKRINERLLDSIIEKYLGFLESPSTKETGGIQTDLNNRWGKILLEDIRLDLDKKYVKDSLLRRIGGAEVNAVTKKEVLNLLSEREYCLI